MRKIHQDLALRVGDADREHLRVCLDGVAERLAERAELILDEVVSGKLCERLGQPLSIRVDLGRPRGRQMKPIRNEQSSQSYTGQATAHFYRMD